MFQAKDGKRREATRGVPERPRAVRAVVASMAVGAGIGALSVARRALSTFLPRRQRPSAAEAAATDTRLQQLTRCRAPDGTHSIHGTLLAEIEPGDRGVTPFVAFCPPFERLPTVEIEAVDDASATVKLAQLLHNGIQIEVRVPEAGDEKQTVTIEMTATGTPE